MDEAKDALRLIGGWSHTSHMPDVYAKRFLSERANAANLHRITHDNHDLDAFLGSLIEGFGHGSKSDG